MKKKKIMKTTAQLFMDGKRLIISSMVTLFVFLTARPVYANSIESSKFYTGTKKMIEDGTGALVKLIPIVGTLMIIICFLMKMASDDMDGKKWNGRMKTIFICIVAGTGAALLISLITGYFA